LPPDNAIKKNIANNMVFQNIDITPDVSVRRETLIYHMVP